MTTEQHGSKTERIAELERERTKLKEREVSRISKGGRVALVNRLDYIDRELSRLRNECGDSKTEEGRGDLIARIEIPLRKSLTFKEAEWVLSTLRQAATFSSLASVEAGRGEREALAIVAILDESEERCVTFKEDRDTVKIPVAIGLIRALRTALSQENGEAVVWRTNEAPVGVPVEIRMPVSYGWWKATAKRHHYPDEEEGRFPNEFWEILHYNGEALLKVFYGSPKLEWRDSAAPPSPPEGVREALETEAEFWCRLLGEATDALDECSGDDEEGWDRQQHAEDAAKRIRAKYFNRKPLTTTPSRGLVEAAEAYDDAATLVNCKAADMDRWPGEPHGKTALRNLCSELRDKAEALRTLSAKGTANADDRDG